MFSTNCVLVAGSWGDLLLGCFYLFFFSVRGGELAARRKNHESELVKVPSFSLVLLTQKCLGLRKVSSCDGPSEGELLLGQTFRAGLSP